MEKGRVTSIIGSEATVSFGDGSERVLTVPATIRVVVGTPVTIFDTGHGKPIYKWGAISG